MKQPRPKTAIVSLKLRIREDLRARLAQAAETQDHSLNSEIARRLEQSFTSETVEEMLQEMHFLAGEQLQAMKEFRQMLKGAKK